MKLIINDTGDMAKLIIKKKGKVILKKQSKSFKALLKFVHNGSSNEVLKKCIRDLEPLFRFMVDSRTEIEIKG